MEISIIFFDHGTCEFSLDGIVLTLDIGKYFNWMAGTDGVECCHLGIDAWMVM